MRGILAVALLSLVLAGCGGGGGPGDPAEVATGDGARELRLHATAGDSSSIRMRMEMAMRVEIEGQELPGVELPVMAMTTDTTVVDVGETIDVEFAVRDVETSGGDEEVRGAMQQGLSGLEGTTGGMRMTDRGEVVDSSVELPTGLDPSLAGVMQQFESQFDQMAIPFPEHPVAVGDSWTETTPLELEGVSQTLEATYTLLALDGDDYRIGVELVQEVEPGPLEGPDGQVVGEIVEGSSTGSGEYEGNLGFVVATCGCATTSGTMRMIISDGSTQQEMVQEMDMTLLFQPAG